MDSDRLYRRDYVLLNALSKKIHILIQRARIPSVQETRRFLPIRPGPSYNLTHILEQKKI